MIRNAQAKHVWAIAAVVVGLSNWALIFPGMINAQCTDHCALNGNCIGTNRTCASYGCYIGLNHPNCPVASGIFYATDTPTYRDRAGGDIAHNYLTSPFCYQTWWCTTVDPYEGFRCPVIPPAQFTLANCQWTGNPIQDNCSKCIETPNTRQDWVVTGQWCEACPG